MHKTLESGPADLVALEVFPLRWRWTDARYAVLSHGQLARIRPLDAAKARGVHQIALASLSAEPGQFDINPLLFETAERTESSGPDVVSWLTRRLPPRNPVTIVRIDGGGGQRKLCYRTLAPLTQRRPGSTTHLVRAPDEPVDGTLAPVPLQAGAHSSNRQPPPRASGLRTTAVARAMVALRVRLLRERDELHEERREEVREKIERGWHQTERGETVPGRTFFDGLREKTAERTRRRA